MQTPVFCVMSIVNLLWSVASEDDFADCELTARVYNPQSQGNMSRGE